MTSATDFVPVAKTSDIAPGKMKLVKANDEFVLLSNVEGKFYAIGAICTHMGALLTDGMVDEEEVMCPDHASRYNLKTGKVVPDMMSKKNVPQYVLQIKGDQIYLSPKPLDLPERKPIEAESAAGAAAAPAPAAVAPAPATSTAPSAPVTATAPVASTQAAAAPVAVLGSQQPAPAAQVTPAPLRPRSSANQRLKKTSMLEMIRGSRLGGASLDFIEGKFLGHPNHALLIHFPSGLFPIALLFDVMSFFMDGAALAKASFYCLAVGLLFVVPSMLTGFLDYFGMPKGSEQKKMATNHWIINTAASAFILVSFLLRLTDLDAPRVEYLWAAVLFVGVSLIIVGNYFGADLIFRMGMRVHRGGPPAPVVVTITKMLKAFRKS